MVCKRIRYGPLFLLFLLFLLLLSGCSSPLSGLSSSPPMPKVTVNEEKVVVLQGSYCWSAYGKGTCADMASPADLLKHNDYQAIKASPGGKVTVSFANKPEEGSMSVQYESGQKLQTIPMEGNSFTIPDEEGSQIYILSANWGQGNSASYVFSIEVKT